MISAYFVVASQRRQVVGSHTRFMKPSYASHMNVDYIEKMFEAYSADPDSIEPSWRHFFEGMAFGENRGSVESPSSDLRIHELIRAYRKWGHLCAQLDPLERPRPTNEQLKLENFGLSQADLDKTFPTFGFLPEANALLKDLIQALKQTWCGHIGLEFLHGSDLEQEAWFEERVEKGFNQPNLSLDVKRSILEKLNEAELFEKFLHNKYPGQKRFSLEGGDGFIPLMAEMIEALATEDVEEVVIGMSHRGRLNVLANIMAKTLEDMFTEFEPNYQPNTVEGDGDVKYHKGYVSKYHTRSGRSVNLTLADNPSHLEAVCPVVQGLVRAHQTMRQDIDRRRIVPILVHGDASFSGQGIVSETLNMSQLKGYKTGGAIHVIINNQIGFTTNPDESRSTVYCSDVARQILAPVFHVNGQDPEAIVHAVQIACAYRQRFNRDVVIDLICYRKHGHNEGDEASFTQPLMYRKIKAMATPRQSYVDQLISQGEVEARVARTLEKEFRKKLDEALALARSGQVEAHAVKSGPHYDDYRRITTEEIFTPVNTSLGEDAMLDLAQAMTYIPADFQAHKKVRRLYQNRMKQVKTGVGIDWGCAEALAYASLLVENIPCRLSGQDVKRGTFSHRHAVIFSMEDEAAYTSLNKLKKGQARFSIYNSHLSELAVLGFEFGYGLARPKCLVIWEAQFGDFSNGAQIIIDQFIASSESKWNRVSNLVMFLPHGYEGQGPEHSSARLERFLQLCAENNIQVANLTEPAQLFHILRRQALRNFRKPLVIMTPKSLLRHEACVSKLNDFTTSGFREIITESQSEEVFKNCTRLLLCSGKIYYDLESQREQHQNVSIVRIEQIYPLATHQLEAIRDQCPNLEEVFWVQEEPQNMGAWAFMEPRLREIFPQPLQYVGRDASASPAVGSLALHKKEQHEIVKLAFQQGVTKE